MPLLFPKLQVTQVFGANTEVGKTLLTTALLRSSAAAFARKFPSSSPSPADSPSARKKRRVFYLKPVSTGPPEEADDAFVKRNAGRWGEDIEARCMYQYREPVSMHLAARLAPDVERPATNEALLKGIANYVKECAGAIGGGEAESGVEGSFWLETAGGVHSPSVHPPLTQLDSLRPLRLPTVLIASPHLGGISTTLSAYESLLMRGYDIPAVLALRDSYYQNHDFLEGWFADRGVRFWSFEKPHEKRADAEEERERLGEYYEKIEREGMGEVVQTLERLHVERIERLDSMPRRTLDSVWWPFTQHGLVNKESQVMVIDSAKGDYFDAYHGKAEKKQSAAIAEEPTKSLLNPLFDGSASWFTQAHTHAHPELTLAAAAAAGRYGHVLFPSSTHEPALALTEELLETVGKGWASRVFFSDNGSTGMEVALKMALRASGVRYGWEGKDGVEVGVIGLQGGYHGDTIGSMDATNTSIFNTATDWYRGRGHWFAPPVVQVRNGQVTITPSEPQDWPEYQAESTGEAPASSWTETLPSLAKVYDVEARTASPLYRYYCDFIHGTLAKLTQEEGRRFGAVVLEPICLGAGGMIFVDPLFQKALVDVVRDNASLFGRAAVDSGAQEDDWKGLPVVFDEVFTGLHRLSYLSASRVLGVKPDIACYAKILTAGLLPLSTTLASTSIYNAFLHPTKKVNALLHGHSYTANPIGCAVALKGLQMVKSKREEASGNWVDARVEWGLGERAKTSLSAPIEGSADLWSLWSQKFVFAASQVEGVKGVMALGTVLAIELEPVGAEVEQMKQTGGGYASSIAQDLLDKLRTNVSIQPTPSSDPASTHAVASTFEPFHIHSRPLGDVMYLMASLWTEKDTVGAIESAIMEGLQRRLA